METERGKARAWVPATVATVLAVVLVFLSGLAAELLLEHEPDLIGDRDSLLSSFGYGQLGALGGPGIIGEGPTLWANFGAGLVPVVVLVFLFTWISARAARRGSALTVLLGAWLGTVLGAGLGALVNLEMFLRDVEGQDLSGLDLDRFYSLARGLYWGTAVGLLVGLVALLVWLMSRRPRPQEPVDGPASYPPPTGEPAGVPAAPPPPPATTEERSAPPPPPPGTEERPAPTAPTPPPPPDDTTRS